MVWKAITDRFHADVDEIIAHEQRRERQLQIRGFAGPGAPARTAKYALSTRWKGQAYVDSKLPNTEGGHLIALELGGADSEYNLAPMYGNVNRGTYRGIERDLKLWVDGTARPALLVGLNYPDPMYGDIRIPTSMHIYRYANVSDLNTVAPRMDALYRVILNTPEAPVRISILDEDIHLRDALIRVKNAFNPNAWRVENQLGDISHSLPPLNRRPNAWLDFLIYSHDYEKLARQLLSKVSSSQFTIGGGQPFWDPQRDLVALAVALTEPADSKKGECWSQDAADPVKTALTKLGTDDGIHVDHIHPMRANGWNVYSNAAVISSLLNKSKGDSLG
jgi:hypothetical protein